LVIVTVRLKFRGRDVSSDDIDVVKALLRKHPGISRRALSLEVCAAWGWTQANGVPCDGVCRALMLKLDRAGTISLPPSRWGNEKCRPRRKRPAPVDLPQEPLVGTLGEIGPLEIRQVRRTEEEPLVCSLIEQHHYLRYTRPVGEHLAYLIRARRQPIACFVWSSAPRHLGPRDRFIGWSPAARKANIRFVAYQSRFLILPWVRVPHLASHLLGALSRRLSLDWERIYAHPIYFTETFVDPSRYRGTCYRAANWTQLGMTTGRGKDDQTNRPNRSLKQVFGYPLVNNFRRRLEGVV
jgi:hypothetical protein